MNTPSITIIIPTYKESKNIHNLLNKIKETRFKHSLNLDVILVDDDSQDGTEEAVNTLNLSWVHLIIRKGVRGLSSAVLTGIEASTSDIIVVMDADLSHPPQSIPCLIDGINQGNEIVVGSRYVSGASTDEKWGFFRWINSQIATFLALPLTNLKDPMSGFFAFKRTIMGRIHYFNPIGYKILLELICKSDSSKLIEVPIHFSDRSLGESKLNLKEQVLYLVHLRRLYIYKFSEASHLIQFILIGLSGVFINLFLMTLFISFGVGHTLSVITAIGISMISNFILNNRLTFSYVRSKPVSKKFFGYLSACGLGAIVNFFITFFLLNTFEICHSFPQIASLGGIFVGTFFNYTLNRYVVFKKVTAK